MIIALTWLWQGLVLAGLTFLLLAALPHLNSATRHALWWAALIGVLCIPLVLAVGAVRDVLAGAPPAPAMDVVDPALVLPPAPDWMSVLCASAWVLASAFGLLRVVHGICVVRTLRRASRPLYGARERRLPLWSETRACARRRPDLRISEGLAGACALGFRRPVILVGRTLVDRLDDATLDQVVMHEYAHLARYDDWLQLLQAIARAVGGLHPAVCWLSHRIDLDREAACDDHVVARTGAARQYATALLEAALAAGARPPAVIIVPGATLRASVLRSRVARLLDPARATGTRATPIAAIGIVLPIIAIVAGPRVAPLVAFVDAVEHALPAQIIAGDLPGVPSPRRAVSAGGGMPTTVPARASGTAARRISRAPGPAPRAGRRPSDPPRMSDAPEPATGLPGVSGAPIESRRLFERVDVRLLSAAPAATMNGLPLPPPAAPASRQVRATSSLAAVQGAASAVAAGAERRGVGLGRAFARAGHAIAGKF
jgi:beta-lactamase regulating signal transducer with metallopeptidase domain